MVVVSTVYVLGCLFCGTMFLGGEEFRFPGPRGGDFIEWVEGKLLLMAYGPF